MSSSDDPISAAAVTAALGDIRERIRRAGGVGVDVLAVTKTFGPAAIEAAVAAGCSAVGENYAQEVVAKREAIATSGAELHFIGQLQTNKVRLVAGVVDVYETVDRPKLASEIARRQPGARVLIQVNTTDEVGKGGCDVDAVEPLVDRARELGLDVAGLMTVGPTVGGPEAARHGFRVVRLLCDELDLMVCSMGMTADLEVAVEEGSTQVRVGTALFGNRSRPVG